MTCVTVTLFLSFNFIWIISNFLHIRIIKNIESMEWWVINSLLQLQLGRNVIYVPRTIVEDVGLSIFNEYAISVRKH